jgi:hypothetical protein
MVLFFPQEKKSFTGLLIFQVVFENHLFTPNLVR